ncbi:PREDICTED: uncharacterized protein K02A2.6-like [Priapulus caudatus]|uniref:RNA-directed DNA polymerase n=1 Tax=Priapulus caudatus TaxID=37621 RepID=A0ABM1DRU9_PRICU|nr:PREDICTED: uncharacterized protein K02A2.6-like [Priapulus caudatus]
MESSKDPVLSELAEVITAGWPGTISNLSSSIRLYWSMRDELSVEDGIILKGHRVVIPTSMKEDILNQLHYGHLGVEKTCLRARDTVCWHNIRKNIEKFVKTCQACQEELPSQQPEPLMPHEIPNRPWEDIGTDLFEFDGSKWLIIADYYSEFQVRQRPHFDSREYRQFSQEWNFQHTASSPRYPKANGFIESMVKTVKKTLIKAKKTGQDQDLALLYLRATPVNNKLPSPGELLRGQKMSTPILTKIPNNQPNKEEIREHLEQRQTDMKQNYDKKSQPLDLLSSGKRVRFQLQEHGPWIPGRVIDKRDEPRSYVLETPNGGQIRRNRSHIRDAPPPKVRFTDNAASIVITVYGCISI